ncbi:MAG: cobamide remodeling phosphodiesterase CbiR [Desulfobacterales bacterium]|nr:cobamide remodeling phosphodiesterase CbiR [Desulfobacterales bacterium]
MTPTDHRKLPRKWKNRYPFRLACPSFVYPADYDVNVDLLGPHVDEIELLFFESRPAIRPDGALIQRLAALGERHAVGYHVHLPTDLPLFDADATRRQTAVRALEALTQLTAPLGPDFYILHLEMSVDKHPAVRDRLRWEKGVLQGLEGLSKSTLEMSYLRIENQTVPLEWLDPVLETFDLALCLDIGHLKLAGGDLESTLARWQARIGALHVHGVADGRDHRPLGRLSAGDQRLLASFLRSYQGCVSVEVFNFDDLVESLMLIEKWMG